MTVSENKKPPVCLTIAGLDPSGGAGIIADIKTFSKFGCFAVAAVSSITFQNTSGVYGSVAQSAETVRQQVLPLIEDFEIAALKTGMLPTGEIINEVANLVTEYGLRNFVVDPVVRSTSGFDLIDDEALRALIEMLFPLADLVTPNIPEAERITGMAVGTRLEIERAAAAMQKMGARNVLIKGGHLPGPGSGGENGKRTAIDYLFVGPEVYELEGEYYETSATHGTGCILSAAIVANLALGFDLVSAVRTAKDFVSEAIRTAPGLGHGNSPINI